MATDGGYTAKRNFMELLQARWDEGKFVCIGLDSDYEKIPLVSMTEPGPSHLEGDRQLLFNRAIVDATHDLVVAYKINSGFYEECLGGWEGLSYTVTYINQVAPGVPIIWDAKRGDIGSSTAAYARALALLEADAITVPPYLGGESLRPLIDGRPHNGIFVLCRTSNPGAKEFQDLLVVDPDSPEDPVPLYQRVADRVANHWNKNGNCGLVAGATYPEDLAKIRQIVGDDVPLLIPGIGAQGGDLEATVAAGKNSRRQGMIINSSRGIIFASSGPDFADVARAKTIELHEAIQRYLQQGGAA